MRLFWHNKPNPYVTPENVQITKPNTPWKRFVIALFIILLFPFMLVFYLIFKPLWGAFLLAGQAGFHLADLAFGRRDPDPRYDFQWFRGFLSHEAASLPHINTGFRKMLYRLSGLHVGKGGFIGTGGILEDLNPENVVLEDNVTVSFGVTMVGHGPKRPKGEPSPKDKMVIIRHNAYVGARVLLIPGVEIGPYATVGAGAVVTKNVPAGAVVAGNPARILYYKPGFDPAEKAAEEQAK